MVFLTDFGIFRYMLSLNVLLLILRSNIAQDEYNYIYHLVSLCNLMSANICIGSCVVSPCFM